MRRAQLGVDLPGADLRAANPRRIRPMTSTGF